MNLSRLAPALAVALVVVSTPGRALDVLTIIKRSQVAERNISYKGSKVADIAVGDGIVHAELRIVHQKPNRTRTDYVSPAGLAGIVTIDLGKTSWTYFPVRKRWQQTKWNPSGPLIDLALKNYKVVSDGKAQVAGRSVYIVKLIPRKVGNPSEILWIDTRTYLTLKSLLWNWSGSLISRSEFREIAFNPGSIPSSIFQVNGETTTGGTSAGDLGFTVTKPRYVPKGYELVQTAKIKIGDGYAAHLMYTNGINTISIFERKKDGDTGRKPPGLGKWANALRFDRRDVTYTIISDISKKELEKIANSLK